MVARRRTPYRLTYPSIEPVVGVSLSDERLQTVFVVIGQRRRRFKPHPYRCRFPRRIVGVRLVARREQTVAVVVTIILSRSIHRL